MRWIAALLATLALSIPGMPAAPAEPSGRARVIAALERLILTGEPRHNSHDDGQWLQEEVDRAFEQNDAELLRLAKRAAQPLVVSLSSVVSSTRSLPWLSVQALPALAVRGGGKYQADIMVSVDGGEAVRLAMPPADSNAGPLDELLPRQASIPGRHTLRFTAQLTFADQTLGVETRALPDVVYGIYQADSVEAASVRSFINAAQNANVRELDPSLPEAPFGAWLQAIAKAAPNADFEPAHEYVWEVHYCDERLGEERAYSAVGDLCTVAHLGVADGHNGIGRILDSHGTHRTGGGKHPLDRGGPIGRGHSAAHDRRREAVRASVDARGTRLELARTRHLGVPRGHSTDARAGGRARGSDRAERRDRGGP